MPAEVVAAGLLHDTIEDTSIKAEDLQRDFDETIVNLVQGVTKLTQLPRLSRGEHREEVIARTNDEAAQKETEADLRNRKHELANENSAQNLPGNGQRCAGGAH